MEVLKLWPVTLIRKDGVSGMEIRPGSPGPAENIHDSCVAIRDKNSSVKLLVIIPFFFSRSHMTHKKRRISTKMWPVS